MLTPKHLRIALQTVLLGLVLLAPLPFGSVQPSAVLAVEWTAAVLGLTAILLLARDAEARAAVPRMPLLLCSGLIALGVFQLIPVPFRMAETFSPTADLVRPLVPYLGVDPPPAVSWSVARPETADALLRFIAYVLIGLSAAVAFDTDRSRRRFAVALVASATFQAVYGSGEYLSGRQHIFAFAKKYYLDSATGTFINRNHFATLLAIALPFALALAIPPWSMTRREGRPWRARLVAILDAGALGRVLAVASSALIWLGLLLSHSRAGLVAALAGATIVLVHFRGVRAVRWAGAIAVGVLVVLLSVDLAQAPGERFLSVLDDVESKGGRVTAWQDSFGLVRARPILGWGLGSFESAFPSVQSAMIDLRYDHAHSDWLEWWTEGGVIAFGIAGILLVHVVRGSGVKGAASNFSATFAYACRAAIVATALHALWDFSLRIPAVAVATAAVMGAALRRTPARPGLASAVDAPYRPSESNRLSTPTWGLVFVCVALVAGDSILAALLHLDRSRVRADLSRPLPIRHPALGVEANVALTSVQEALKSALTKLETLPPIDSSISDYRTTLAASLRVLTSSLISHPLDGRMIQSLAAIDSELSLMNGTGATLRTVALLKLAASRSSRSADFQLDLADTLLRVGELREATAVIVNAIALRPGRTERAVHLMLDRDIGLDQIAASLPASSELLVTLKAPFLSAGRGADYLERVGTWKGAWDVDLVASFGDACLHLNRPQVLSRTLLQLGTLRSPSAEAQRQHLLGWAAYSQRDFDGARTFASTACRIRPEQPGYREFLGDCEQASEHDIEARSEFQEAITLSVRQGWTAEQRARLYGKLGRAYERLAQGDKAYDAYRRALELNPSDPLASERLHQLTSR